MGVFVSDTLKILMFHAGNFHGAKELSFSKLRLISHRGREKMENLLRVSPTGQLTLPRPVRVRLGLDSGGYLGLEVRESGLWLRLVQIIPVTKRAGHAGGADDEEAIAE